MKSLPAKIVFLSTLLIGLLAFSAISPMPQAGAASLTPQGNSISKGEYCKMLKKHVNRLKINVSESSLALTRVKIELRSAERNAVSATKVYLRIKGVSETAKQEAETAKQEALFAKFRGNKSEYQSKTRKAKLKTRKANRLHKKLIKAYDYSIAVGKQVKILKLSKIAAQHNFNENRVYLRSYKSTINRTCN